MESFVAYYRVSTVKQGESGLGLAAQKKDVLDFVGSGTLCAEFTDVESGKKDDRPELVKALQVCKDTGAKLVIAKLDRLSRSMVFIASLMESKVKFVAVDMPDANEFTIHIFAALAEQERKMISDRTKRGLERARAKGQKLGSPANLTAEARAKGIEVIKAKATSNRNTTRARVLANMLREDGMTLMAIADILNESGHRTPMGKMFSATQVRRLIK